MWSTRKFLLTVSILFLPLYFFRLRSLPVYQIPEDIEIKVQGRISRQPYLKGSYQIIFLGPISVKTNRFPGYFYHQKIEAIGKLERRVINRFQTQDIMYFPTIRLIEEGQDRVKKFNLQTALFSFRGRVEKTVGELLPEPQSSLLLGILLGVKRQMPQEFWQGLQKTGTLHIIVASGQNVTMVVWVLVEILTWIVSRKKALVAALIGVIFHVLMVGAEAPVVRAGIMAGVVGFGQFWGREEERTVALLIAAGLMLLASPLLLFDIGFQLSFAATAGIIWLYPILSSFFKDTPFKRSILIRAFGVFGQSLATTIAAQLGVMPIILVNFGQMSPFSPLVNGAVLWVVPLVMVLGGVVVSLALIIRPLAQVLAWFVWLLLTYFVKIIEFSGKLPWASFELGKLSPWWAVGYYFVLVLIVVRYRHVYKQA